MKLLVIGCNGFIGSHTSLFFKTKDYEVFGADIKSSDNSTFILSQNLSNLDVLFKSNAFDYCINASGSSTVSFSLQHEKEDFMLNYKNVEKILEAIKHYQPLCKFINLSSAAVYGNPMELPIKESTATNPISPYGQHKLLSEKLLQEFYLKHQMQTISLRVFSVYGIGLKKQLFWDIYQKSLLDNNLQLFGTGAETRDFIYIDDLMCAFEQILLQGNFDGSVINVASGNETSINLAANTFVQYLNPKLIVNFTGLQNNADPDHWQADISCLKNLGFLPQVSLEEGLKKYAGWLRELN